MIVVVGDISENLNLTLKVTMNNSSYIYSRVWEIYEMLHPKPDDLISTMRFFVKEGEMQIWDEKKKKKKKRYFFLFNDILLLCRRESHKRYWLRIHITLRSPYVSVEDIENASYNNSLHIVDEFRLHCRSRSFILYALSPDHRREWIKDLQNSITGNYPEENKGDKKETEKKSAPKTKQDTNKSKSTTEKKVRRDDDSQDGSEDSPDTDEEQEIAEKKKKKTETKAPKSARTKSTSDKTTKKMIKKREPVSSGAGDLLSFDPFSQNMRAQTPNPFVGGVGVGVGVSSGITAGQPGWNNNPFLSGNTGTSISTAQTFPNLPFGSFGPSNSLVPNVSGMGGVGGIGGVGSSQVGGFGGVGGVGGVGSSQVGGYGAYGVNVSTGFASPSVNPFQDASAGVGYGGIQQQQTQLVVNPFVQHQQPFAGPTNTGNPFIPVSSQGGTVNPFAPGGTSNPQQQYNPLF